MAALYGRGSQRGCRGTPGAAKVVPGCRETTAVKVILKDIILIFGTESWIGPLFSPNYIPFPTSQDKWARKILHISANVVVEVRYL